MQADPAHLKELVGLGSRSTPTTVVETADGREVIVGFNQTRLRALLGF